MSGYFTPAQFEDFLGAVDLILEKLQKNPVLIEKVETLLAELFKSKDKSKLASTPLLDADKPRSVYKGAFFTTAVNPPASLNSAKTSTSPSTLAYGVLK